MQKIVRSLALAALVALALVPAAKADRWGGFPRPDPCVVSGELVSR